MARRSSGKERAVWRPPSAGSDVARAEVAARTARCSRGACCTSGARSPFPRQEDLADMTTHVVVPDPGRLGRGGAGAPGACAARALIRRSRLVRSVVKSPAVQRQIGACRGVKVVRGAARFAVLELVGTGTRRYELRDSGLAVHVRHRTGDVVILNKIFARDAGRNSYEPPPQVAALLDAAPS